MPITNPVQYSRNGATAAVIFAHGFTGEGGTTWEGFPELLTKDPELTDHDFYFWSYPTELKLRYAITKYFWEDDPNIGTLGQGLRTLLTNSMDRYEKLVLVGHSMGGLVIQAFILEEIKKGRPSRHLERLTEVVLYGTPSGGLQKASWGAFLKNQVADMSDCGPFIDKLRNGWKQMVDDQRSDSHRAAQFRLTVVSGMKDTFVPQESALDPFPLDEHEIAPGNHTEMVKPVVVGELPYQILKKRLLRRTPTASQRRLINGEDEEVLREMNRIRAAAELDDIETLTELATKLLAQTDSLLPLVDRALGLALLGHEQYQQAAALLNRYVKFRMPDDQSQPFRSDAQAIQQLAIALSGAGDLAGAVAGLRELPVQMQEDPETQGILAGRFKRQWLKSKSSLSLGRRTFQLYKAAYEKAQSAANLDQIFYNGVNAAYLDFALGGADYKVLASEVLARCKEKTPPDYWSEATCAEAHLLLRQYAEASTAYKKAIACGPAPRHFTSTGQQALDIIKRQGNPEGAAEIITLFAGIRSDY